MIKIAQEDEEGRVRMIVKTSMESPQIIVTDGDDLKVFLHIFGFFYDRIWQNYIHNIRVIKLLFSPEGEYGPTSSPGNWSVLTSLCQIEILHLEASGMASIALERDSNDFRRLYYFPVGAVDFANKILLQWTVLSILVPSKNGAVSWNY